MHSTFFFEGSQGTLLTWGPKAPGEWHFSQQTSRVRQLELKSVVSKFFLALVYSKKYIFHDDLYTYICTASTKVS